MSRMVTITGPTLRICMDPSEICKHDPGQGTPVMVYDLKSDACATWWCATGEGELNDRTLTDREQAWLDSKRNEVEGWCEENGV